MYTYSRSPPQLAALCKTMGRAGTLHVHDILLNMATAHAEALRHSLQVTLYNILHNDMLNEAAHAEALRHSLQVLI